MAVKGTKTMSKAKVTGTRKPKVAKATKAAKPAKVTKKVASKKVGAPKKSATPKRVTKTITKKTATTTKKTAPKKVTAKKTTTKKNAAKKTTRKTAKKAKPNKEAKEAKQSHTIEKKTTQKKTLVEGKSKAIRGANVVNIATRRPGPNKKEKSVEKTNYSSSAVLKKAAVSGVGMLGIAPYQEKPNEAYMNETQKVHFRNLLLRWKQSLMEEVDRTVSDMRREASDVLADPNDRASREEVFTFELRASDRERKLIKKIEEALEKIEHDEYGYCDTCGIEIGIRRLEARPIATLCIDCKTLDEIKERQQGG